MPKGLYPIWLFQGAENVSELNETLTHRMKLWIMTTTLQQAYENAMKPHKNMTNLETSKRLSGCWICAHLMTLIQKAYAQAKPTYLRIQMLITHQKRALNYHYNEFMVSTLAIPLYSIKISSFDCNPI